MKHKHDWVRLMPELESLSTETRLNLYVDTIGNSLLFRTVVCWCGKTAHRVNSNRGGFRVHQGDYFLNKAKELAARHNFTLPIK